MSEPLRRLEILLNSEQYQRLVQLARHQGKSEIEVATEIIDAGLSVFLPRGKTEWQERAFQEEEEARRISQLCHGRPRF